MSKRILTVIGARPQFIKAAAVSHVLKSEGFDEVVLHTGQHFDYEMDRVFFEELGMDMPVKNLAVGGGHHGEQTARMLEGIENYIIQEKREFDLVLVYGDTNSTMAAGLAAAKLHIPVAHVEAGLRSFNMSMPEEINRRLTDHLSNWLFCPSGDAARNLENEGITRNVHVTGDVMLDAMYRYLPVAEKRNLPKGLMRDGYYLFTLHRPGNTDNPAMLSEILAALSDLSMPVVWPVHPRMRDKLASIELPGNIRCLEPQSYLAMLKLLRNCSALLTDSGGMQKEAYWMQKPCITLRNETEWVETLENGWNVLLYKDHRAQLPELLRNVPGEWKPLYGEGNAAVAIVKTIMA